jgi:hypothetical protein
MKEYMGKIKDLKCWVKHFYQDSNIPELTRIKAIRRCCSFMMKVLNYTWEDYKRLEKTLMDDEKAKKEKQDKDQLSSNSLLARQDPNMFEEKPKLKLMTKEEI